MMKSIQYVELQNKNNFFKYYMFLRGNRQTLQLLSARKFHTKPIYNLE